MYIWLYVHNSRPSNEQCLESLKLMQCKCWWPPAASHNEHPHHHHPHPHHHHCGGSVVIRRARNWVTLWINNISGIIIWTIYHGCYRDASWKGANGCATAQPMLPCGLWHAKRNGKLVNNYTNLIMKLRATSWSPAGLLAFILIQATTRARNISIACGQQNFLRPRLAPSHSLSL